MKNFSFLRKKVAPDLQNVLDPCVSLAVLSASLAAEAQASRELSTTLQVCFLPK
jgi:hypothetical protein